MNTFVVRSLAIGMTCLALVACESEPTLDTHLIDTYARVVFARETYAADTVAAQAEVRRILAQANFTPESFETTLRGHANDAKRFRALYDSVSVRLTAMRGGQPNTRR